MAFSVEQINAINRLSNFKNYFERNNKGLFEAESTTARNIIMYLESIEEFTEKDILTIAALYNKVLSIDHLNGSGWADFKIHLMTVFYKFGYDSNLEIFNDKTELILTKTTPKAILDVSTQKVWWKFWH